MTEPLMTQAVAALARGHRLFASTNFGDASFDTPAQLDNHVGGPALFNDIPAAAMRRTTTSTQQLRRSAASDDELAHIMAAARNNHAQARRATRNNLEAARADADSAADTPLGRREAIARTVARLRSQHGHVLRSRQHARLLALRLRRLRYAHGRRRNSNARSGTGHAAVSVAIRKALDIKGIHNPIARVRWERGMDLVARRESGYNAHAVNAANGRPSVGAWQFIASTFAAYHEPGTSPDIQNLVAQACAFINYARGRYGVAADAWNLTDRIQQADPRRSPKGY